MQSSIYNEQPKDKIRRIELELTSVCNLKCPLCMRERMELPVAESRPILDIIHQLNEYPNLQYVTIAGAIAEPTSHQGLFELLAYLRKRTIEVSLYINGDARNDMYYVKLGTLFREVMGNVYFTMCGSTQELHEKYRVGSNLERVLKRLDIVNRYSNGKGILTWIVFNYNEQDFEENYQRFKDKYNTEFFYTLPVNEHFQMDNDIHLPDTLHKIYLDQIDRTDYNVERCPANKNDFIQIIYDGSVVPCSLYRLYGESNCFECSKKNLAVLRSNRIFNVAEAESEDSELPMRLYYDRN